MKGANVPGQQFVSVSDTKPNGYWQFPEPDMAWKLMKDVGMSHLFFGGGQEGNVLNIMMNPDHPYYPQAYNPHWAVALDNFLAKGAGYGFKMAFHVMGSHWGTCLGFVAPMQNFDYVNPYTSIAEMEALLDQLGGDNELGHNFLADPRVPFWQPMNEAHLDDPMILEWLLAALRKIRSYGGKTTVCVNDQPSYWEDYPEHTYAYCYPYIIPLIGNDVDYLQSHVYHWEVQAECTADPTKDIYALTYNAFLPDFQAMRDRRGSFPLDRVILSEFACVNGTMDRGGTYGVITLTPHQQAEYLRGVFDAARATGITNLVYHEPIHIAVYPPTYNISVGFIDYNGTIFEEPYNVYKFDFPAPIFPINLASASAVGLLMLNLALIGYYGLTHIEDARRYLAGLGMR